MPEPAAEPEPLPWFQVSPRKFGIMSFFTWGIYTAFWSYKQWLQIKLATGEDLSPFWRAFFGPLWNFALFARVKEHGRLSSVAVSWNTKLLAVAFIVMTATLFAP